MTAHLTTVFEGLENKVGKVQLTESTDFAQDSSFVISNYLRLKPASDLLFYRIWHQSEYMGICFKPVDKTDPFMPEKKYAVHVIEPNQDAWQLPKVLARIFYDA